MMFLRIECTKFGGEAPKKFEGTCGVPVFFIFKASTRQFTTRRIYKFIREIYAMLAPPDFPPSTISGLTGSHDLASKSHGFPQSDSA